MEERAVKNNKTNKANVETLKVAISDPVVQISQVYLKRKSN